MAPEIGAIVLWSPRAAEVVAFYRAIGVPLEDERHEEGPAHWACSLGPVHFAVFEAAEGAARGRAEGGATMIGLSVTSLEEAVAAAVGMDARVLVLPEEVPWGRRAVVADPDGRSVELNQR